MFGSLPCPAACLVPSPCKGFDNLYVDINFASIHAHVRKVLWPLSEISEKLGGWFDLSQTEEDLKAVL